jgi:6-phosphogluconolactonase
VDFVVVPAAGDAAAAVAALLGETAEAGGSIVLTGGSTPRYAYELVAASHTDWGGVDVWFGDERHVPLTDSRSNQLLAREALLERLVIPPAVHWIDTGLPAAEAAAAYEAELAREPLDLVLLGLGPDGHTASLFPGMPSLGERERLVVATPPGLEPFVERITLTIPALESGAHVVFLAVGEGKADAARRAFAGEPACETPASLVRSRTGKTTVILDEAAAALLP